MLEQVRLVLIAFAVGYLTRHFNPLNWSQVKEAALTKLHQLSPTLLVFLGLATTLTTLCLFLWPLARIANWEAQGSTEYKYRTSARENLKRRVGWVFGREGVVVASKAEFANARQVTEYLCDFHQHRSAHSERNESSQRSGDTSARHIGSLRELHHSAQDATVQPKVIGYLSREGEGLCEPDVRDSSALWVDAFTARTQVAFRSVLLYGAAVPCRIIIIVYEESVAEPWHFYTASPINLDLSAAMLSNRWCIERQRECSRFQNILDHINLAGQIYVHLHGAVSRKSSRGLLDRTWSAFTYSNRQSNDALQPRETKPGSSLFGQISNTFLVLSAHLLRLVDTVVAGYEVKRFSAVGQQLDFVLRRATYLIEQWKASYYTKQPLRGGRQHNAQYASFWNSVWVIALDIIIGCVLGTLLIVYSHAASDLIVSRQKRHTITSLEETIGWLRGWPAGLKLNNGLDGFLAELFLWLIHFWTVIFQPITRYLRAVVLLAGWSGFVGGCSMQLSILSDTLTLTTLHTYWFYMVATRIFFWILVTLSSLFNLFRGRKHNVLRNRIDSCDYGLDQLLIGTILFTLLTYLFPTVLVYYLTFAGHRVVVVMAQGILEIILGILNHCPIFYAILRIRDPQMFPAGVSYSVKSSYAPRFIEAAWHMPGSPVRLSRDPIPLSARNRLDVTVVQMDSAPMPFSSLFFQYLQIWNQFIASYLSFGLLRSLLGGKVIRPFPRLQHMMIPGLLSEQSLDDSGSSRGSAGGPATGTTAGHKNDPHSFSANAKSE
ncbi:pig-Q [Coemansia sp. RSA 1200]|nr:pig-Q [Coemansia sp. RSA 1200]